MHFLIKRPNKDREHKGCRQIVCFVGGGVGDAVQMLAFPFEREFLKVFKNLSHIFKFQINV